MKKAPKMKARLGKNVDQQELKRLPAVIRSKFLVVSCFNTRYKKPMFL